MTTIDNQDKLKQIDHSIDRAITYLVNHQFPNGEFVTYIAPDAAMQEWCVPDSVTGVTALIGQCLLPFEDRPVVDTMLNRACGFLSYQMMRGGVWNYFTRWHHLFKFLSPDTDDTVVISAFLKRRKVSFPDNTRLLLENRTKKGLFYTWFTIHPEFKKYSKTYWRLIARELKSPFKTLWYWMKHDHRRSDIDLVVNANCVCYLGYSDITKPSVDFIVETLKSGKEKGSDKWYINMIVYYSFLSRLFEMDIPGFDEIKEIFIEKVKKAIDNSQVFMNCSIELALATSSLLRAGYKNNTLLKSYTDRITELQQSTGEWERYEFCSGPAKILVWGSEELSTAFCIEALQLYKKHLS